MRQKDNHTKYRLCKKNTKERQEQPQQQQIYKNKHKKNTNIQVFAASVRSVAKHAFTCTDGGNVSSRQSEYPYTLLLFAFYSVHFAVCL